MVQVLDGCFVGLGRCKFRVGTSPILLGTFRMETSPWMLSFYIFFVMSFVNICVESEWMRVKARTGNNKPM